MNTRHSQEVADAFARILAAIDMHKIAEHDARSVGYMAAVKEVRRSVEELRDGKPPAKL